jgi:Tfp pilus assembly protein FimV
MGKKLSSAGREQNRSRLQGDLFGGLSAEARADHAKVAQMRARIARLPELQKQRDEARAQRAARRRSVEKARERKQASADGRSMGETRAARAASSASLPAAPKGQHYVAHRDGKVNLIKTSCRRPATAAGARGYPLGPWTNHLNLPRGRHAWRRIVLLTLSASLAAHESP